jgi:hypothetical protein
MTSAFFGRKINNIVVEVGKSKVASGLGYQSILSTFTRSAKFQTLSFIVMSIMVLSNSLNDTYFDETILHDSRFFTV